MSTNIENKEQKINDQTTQSLDNKLKKLVQGRDGIFACGDNQINSAQVLLDRESVNLGAISAAMINNFTQSTVAYLTYFASNNNSSDDIRKDYKKAYYHDRCHTALFFIAILIVYKKCSKGIFNTLKDAVNNSICTIDDFVRLKSEVPPGRRTEVTINQPQA